MALQLRNGRDGVALLNALDIHDQEHEQKRAGNGAQPGWKRVTAPAKPDIFQTRHTRQTACLQMQTSCVATALIQVASDAPRIECCILER
jgi:hypothetical protein